MEIVPKNDMRPSELQKPALDMSVACPGLTPAALAFPAAGASTAHTHKLNYSALISFYGHLVGMIRRFGVGN